jgi:hypothetical protein
MPMPSLADAVAAFRLIAGRPLQQAYWSEQWFAPTTFLSELVGVLRASRPTQLVDVGEGWDANRDLSLTIGRWGWLHVRSVVEEHARGRCLLRLAGSIRPTFHGAAQLLAAGIVLVAAESAAMALSLHKPSVIILSVIALAVLACRAGWQAARTVAVLRRAIARVTGDLAIQSLPVAAEARSLRVRPAHAFQMATLIVIGLVAGYGTTRFRAPMPLEPVDARTHAARPYSGPVTPLTAAGVRPCAEPARPANATGVPPKTVRPSEPCTPRTPAVVTASKAPARPALPQSVVPRRAPGRKVT